MSKLILGLFILALSITAQGQQSDLYNSTVVKVTEGKGDVSPSYSSCIGLFHGVKWETLFTPFSHVQPASDWVGDQRTFVRSDGDGKIEIITDRGSATFERDKLNCTGTSYTQNLAKMFAEELDKLKDSYKKMNKNDAAMTRKILNSKSCRALSDVDSRASFFSLAPTKDTIVLPTVYRAP